MSQDTRQQRDLFLEKLRDAHPGYCGKARELVSRGEEQPLEFQAWIGRQVAGYFLEAEHQGWDGFRGEQGSYIRGIYELMADINRMLDDRDSEPPPPLP